MIFSYIPSSSPLFVYQTSDAHICTRESSLMKAPVHIVALNRGGKVSGNKRGCSPKRTSSYKNLKLTRPIILGELLLKDIHLRKCRILYTYPD